MPETSTVAFMATIAAIGTAVYIAVILRSRTRRRARTCPACGKAFRSHGNRYCSARCAGDFVREMLNVLDVRD